MVEHSMIEPGPPHDDTSRKNYHRLSRKTLNRLERASGRLASASIAAMEQKLPWFSRLPAEQRANVLLITQNGASGFVSWLRNSDEALKLTTDAFRDAPTELSRWISLRQAVGLVRLAIEVFESELPHFAETESEEAALREGILRYGREIAFTTANSYAVAAEARGAWDARLEALVVDGVVRGDDEEFVLSRATALGWEPETSATVLIGQPPSDDPPTIVFDVRSKAARIGRPVLLSVQGTRLIVIAGNIPPSSSAGAEKLLATLSEAFGPGPVVVGPTAPTIAQAHISAADALSGFRAVASRPTASRPIYASDLLPERVLSGDSRAKKLLLENIFFPLENSGNVLLSTVDEYLETGGVLESCARNLFVHPNTVRYRLHRITDLTGYNAMESRDALALRMALILGRLSQNPTSQHDHIE